jgi:threonine/homoserine/homoserine lactone efflux protein
MSALFELAFGLALGFSLTVPPGPMNALMAQRSIVSYRRGFLTGLGAMSADLILGASVFVLQSEIDLGAVVRFVYLLGAAVMAFLAYRILRPQPGEGRPPSGELATYTSALAVGLSNPFQILWWLTAGIAFAYLGGVLLLAGLFGAILVWILAFPYAMHVGVRERPRLERAVVIASGAILLGFSVYFAFLAV